MSGYCRHEKIPTIFVVKKVKVVGSFMKVVGKNAKVVGKAPRKLMILQMNPDPKYLLRNY